MSFIAKNPLILPEIKNTPSTPPGTRGVFATKEGLYEIDANGNVTRIAIMQSFINILGGAENWIPENVVDIEGNIIGVRYGQAVTVKNANITPNSKVDLQLSSEQMVIFYEKDLAFVAENEDGEVTGGDALTFAYLKNPYKRNDREHDVKVAEENACKWSKD